MNSNQTEFSNSNMKKDAQLQKNSSSMFDVDFRDLGFLLLKRLWLIVLVFAVVFSYEWFFKEQKKHPTYTASASMYVTNSNDTKYYYSTSDTYNAQNLIKTCGVVIKTNQVLNSVAEKLNENEQNLAAEEAAQGKTYTPKQYYAGQLAGSISVSSVNKTEVMNISVTTGDPQSSIDICNMIVHVIPDVLVEKIKVGAAETLDYATYAYKGNLPTMGTPLKYGAIAAGIVAVFVVVSYLLDTRIKSKEEITEEYGLAVLSEIPNFNVKAKERYRTYYEHR